MRSDAFKAAAGDTKDMLKRMSTHKVYQQARDLLVSSGCRHQPFAHVQIVRIR
jgi:hypothetical protein